MKYLVGDIGNTLTKVSLLNEKFKIIKSFNIETKMLYNKKNRKKFLKKFFFYRISIKKFCFQAWCLQHLK